MQSAQQTQSGVLGTKTTKFRLIAELGRGGMATVYLAVVSGMGGFNKLQVVKQLRSGLAADPEFLNMFLEEARLAARINHPNVVQTYEVGFDGQHHFIAMEYLEGQSLESIIRLLTRKGDDGEETAHSEDFPMPMRLRIIAETLGGLHFAHELTDFDGTPLNVVHRDVSPHNIIVTYDGHVKVLDFGIAKAADSSADTRTGILKGKCAYMAPEQFGGTGVDRRADVFVAGIIMWQMLTGKKMWRGLSDADIFKRLATGQISSPRAIDPTLPEKLDEICMKALALKPEERYQTAADFQSALEDYLATATPRVTARDVGGWVSRRFADRRAKIKATIEQQMKAVKEGPIPLLQGQSTSIEFVPPPSSAEISQQLSSAAVPVARGGGPARLIRLLSLAIIGLVAAVVVVVVVLRPKPHGEAAVRSAKAPTPFGNPATPLVTLSISAKPAAATIYVDDVPLPSNPATTTMVRDGASHRVRAEAAGYVTKHELVEFNSANVMVELLLDEKKETPGAVAGPTKPQPRAHGAAPGHTAHPSGGTPAATQPEAPSVPETKPPTPAPTETAKGTKQPALDQSDPWAH